MKIQPLLASQIYAQPWCILPSAHAEIGKLYQQYIRGELSGEAQPLSPTNLHGAKRLSYGIAYDVSEDGKMAVIYAEGIIAKKAPDMFCGPTTIDLVVLDQLLGDVSRDPAIQTLVIYLDTPGGSVIGLEETGMNIDDVKAAGKRVVTYSDTLCASAGYRVSANCDAIYAAPSALIGSIGTYIAAIDDSRAWEMEGLKLKLFKDGDLKAVGHPGKEWTADEEAWMQSWCDEAAVDFKAHVRAHRPALSEEAMQGQVHTAKHAPEGLVDGLYRDLASCIAAEWALLS